MARMQIRKEDKISDDPHQHAQLSKRGECIALVDDAHQFSPSESAVYAIVDVPGVAQSYLSSFYSEDVQDHREHRLLRRRAFVFDLDRWNGKALTLKEALALKVRHKPLMNPDVIGMNMQ